MSYGIQIPAEVVGTLLLLSPDQVGKLQKPEEKQGSAGSGSHLVFMLELEVDKNQVPLSKCPSALGGSGSRSESQLLVPQARL